MVRKGFFSGSGAAVGIVALGVLMGSETEATCGKAVKVAHRMAPVAKIFCNIVIDFNDQKEKGTDDKLCREACI